MLNHFLFGKLTWDQLAFHIPLVRYTNITILVLALLVVLGVTYFKKWGYLWNEWFTTVDHKKIGIMYIILAIIMLLRGFADAVLMRLQQMEAVGASHGFLAANHFSEIFSAHGTIMIFFMAMPFMFGLINLALPLQIGARDVAFPYLNSLSLWLTVFAACLIMASLMIGDFSHTGWLAYPPLSGIKYSPGVGVDYYIWAVQISGIGSLLSGVNFTTTIIKLRAPGMTLMKMPIFTWTVLCSMILVMLAFPILTVTLALLTLDRVMDMHFFTIAAGGNLMMYINLIWAWGHPEVYILILPAFGIYSEVTATFCKKRLFGYKTMVWATVSITFLSFVVWLHHFFTMGSGANVNAFFGITTMIIAIPTGVKIFNWLFTMYKGRVEFSSPIIWTIGFIITFVIGGMTGVLLAVPPADFQLHNSVFLVAHFHNAILGGVVFGYLAGLTYWFPKIFGFKLNEALGKASAYCWIFGFFIAFMPLYLVGLKGMTRRLYHYTDYSWHPYLVVAAIGAAVIAAGILFFVLQLVVSVINRDKPGYKDTTGDPWGGRTLEWSIPSPAPFYNFAHTPHVDSIDQFWEDKQKKANGTSEPAKPFEDIHMPCNTGAGFMIGLFAALFGFGIIWHIVWMGFFGVIGIIATLIFRSFNMHTDYYVKASEVASIEQAGCA
ncbi:MAG: cytochrome o ubiquinol oxidase subunit I [Coxiellaceae bacterium]|nr:cytochrome o ubiquinol oxidase subunit I [Coxiellaceae bacterium]